MSIDLKLVSQLRDQTGAGINDCQKALVEAEGDLTKAIEILRKKGEVKAAKKADRAAKEGVVALSRAGDKIAAVALACETDFAARNEEFVAAANFLAQELLTKDEASFKESADVKIKNELVVKIGENIQLADYRILTGPVIGTYIHFDKKNAGVVILDGGDEALASDIAMQVVAMSPKYLNPEAVPAEIIEKEKEIYREQLKGEGKPEAIWEKILVGKLAKFYAENCLLNQSYIKDEDKTIADLLGGATVKEFARLQI